MTTLKLLRITVASLALCHAANAQTKSVAATPEKTTREQVAEAMARVPKEHPRLFMNAARFKTLRSELESHELGKLAYKRLIAEADALLSQPPNKREITAKRLLQISRGSLHRMTMLAMAYRLAGNKAHLKRCVEEMDAVARFSDWNPSHFLDTAEMTLGLATAYDWLYHDLDAETRERIAKAILEKGLMAGKKKEWDEPNPGVTQIIFEILAPESGDLAFSILFTPGG